MTTPLKVLRFHEGDEVDIRNSNVPAVVEGHEVDAPCFLWVTNYGGPATVTVMTYQADPKHSLGVVIAPATFTVRKRVSPTSPSSFLIGMFAPGPIRYDRHYKNLTVCAFRFDPKPA